jgi:hypothetical protein
MSRFKHYGELAFFGLGAATVLSALVGLEGLTAFLGSLLELYLLAVLVIFAAHVIVNLTTSKGD